MRAWATRTAFTPGGAARVASLVGASPDEIVFTGGGSVSDNLAIKGAVWSAREAKKHIITSSVEHHAILDTFKWLGKKGWDVTFLPVDGFGMVSPESLASAIRDDTLLASVMYANNEVGTINPVAKLGEVCRERGVLFHTDAVQAAGHIPIDVKKLPVDMMTMSAHKMYGPKGIGALYIRKGIKLTPLVHGGGQEFGLYSGTENVPSIAGMGAAAGIAARLLEAGEAERVAGLRDLLLDGIISRIPDSFVTGHRTERLPYHASVCVKRLESEGILRGGGHHQYGSVGKIHVLPFEGQNGVAADDGRQAHRHDWFDVVCENAVDTGPFFKPSFVTPFVVVVAPIA